MPTSGPDEVPLAEVIPPPIIVAKVNDQGTDTPRDDSLLRGAAFAIHADDGDRTYEPESDELVWDGTARLRFPRVPRGARRRLLGGRDGRSDRASTPHRRCWSATS